MTDEFNQELCNEKHKDLDRRVTGVETLLQKVANRLPLWATFLITGLSSLCTALIVFVATRIHG